LLLIIKSGGALDPADKNIDPVYRGLMQYYGGKFMNLTAQEQKSIQLKIFEWQNLLKKSALLSFVLVNMNMNSLRDVLVAIERF